MVITVANHKGGPGKSTSVLTVAHILLLSSVPVSILDLDAPSDVREAGASQSLRVAEGLGIPAFTLDNLPDEVPGHLIIDGPPDIADRGLEMVLEFTDKLIIPTGIHKRELEVSEIFYEGTSIAGEKSIFFTRVPHYAQSVLEQKRALLEDKGINVMNTHIPRMAVFEHAEDADTTVAGMSTYVGRAATRSYRNLCKEMGIS